MLIRETIFVCMGQSWFISVVINISPFHFQKCLIWMMSYMAPSPKPILYSFLHANCQNNHWTIISDDQLDIKLKWSCVKQMTNGPKSNHSRVPIQELLLGNWLKIKSSSDLKRIANNKVLNLIKLLHTISKVPRNMYNWFFAYILTYIHTN